MRFQVVYNANKLADLVEEKKKKENWLDYYELKFSRKPDQRPMTKVISCNEFYKWALLELNVSAHKRNIGF